MYETDLGRITLEEYAFLLRTQDLPPSRRILPDGLDDVLAAFAGKGVSDLSGVFVLLKNKKAYQQLANELGTTSEYLNILRRDISGYAKKPLSLAGTGLFSDYEIEAFTSIGIKITKDIYERISSKSDRAMLSAEIGVDTNRIEEIAGCGDHGTLSGGRRRRRRSRRFRTQG